MKDTEPDLRFLSFLALAQISASEYAQSKLVGRARIAFINEYARAFKKYVVKKGSSYSKLFDDFDTLSQVLESNEVVRKLKVERLDGGKLKVIIKGCISARSVHSALGIVDRQDYPCAIATLAMIALANEQDKRVGEVLDYLGFNGKLSYLTKDGSETTFIIDPKK